MSKMYTREFFVKSGAKGGNATKNKHGNEFFKKISKKGVKARKQKHG